MDDSSSTSGLALISALLVLAFLSLAGAAFLSTSSVEVRIAENYSAHTRLRYLAEAGIAEARERLRTSGDSLADHLTTAAGPDRQLEITMDLTELLVSDDLPVLPVDPRRRQSGEAEPSSFGEARARWHVFMRNDAGDGAREAMDRNGVVTLLSIARLNDSEYRVEADVMRRLPPVASALSLFGTPGPTGLGQAVDLRIDGTDRCAAPPVHAIGVVRDEDVTEIVAEIPPPGHTRYPGSAPAPDVFNVSDLVPGYVQTRSGVGRLVSRLATVATDVYQASGSGPARVGPIGSRTDPRVVLVEGDAVLEPGSGYGILIVRGIARISMGFTWHGLVIVGGTGRLEWNAAGSVYGAVIVARSEGTPDSGLGDVVVDFSRAAGGIYYDTCALADAFRFLPLSPIAIRNF